MPHEKDPIPAPASHSDDLTRSLYVHGAEGSHNRINAYVV
jgi:hypothetical protein